MARPSIKNETAIQKWQFEQDRAFSDLINELGADRGFLPGSDGEKLYPYIAPFLDNLDAMSENSNIKDYLLFEGQDDKNKKVFFDSIQSM